MRDVKPTKQGAQDAAKVVGADQLKIIVTESGQVGYSSAFAKGWEALQKRKAAIRKGKGKK